MDRLIEYLNRKIAVTATEISKDFGVSLGEARKMLFNYIQNYESNFNCIYSSFDPSNRKFSLITEEQMFNCSMCEIEVYGIVRENYDKITLLTNSYKLRDDPPLGNHKKGVLVSTLPVVKIENRIQKDGTPAITTGKKLKRNSLDFYFNPPKRVKPNCELSISDIKRQVKLNNDGKLVLEEHITYEEQ